MSEVKKSCVASPASSPWRGKHDSPLTEAFSSQRLEDTPGTENDKTPCKEFVDERTPCKEFVDERTPCKEFVDERTPCKEVVDERTPCREVVDERTPCREVVDEKISPVQSVKNVEGFQDAIKSSNESSPVIFRPLERTYTAPVADKYQFPATDFQYGNGPRSQSNEGFNVPPRTHLEDNLGSLRLTTVSNCNKEEIYSLCFNNNQLICATTWGFKTIDLQEPFKEVSMLQEYSRNHPGSGLPSGCLLVRRHGASCMYGVVFASDATKFRLYNSAEDRLIGEVRCKSKIRNIAFERDIIVLVTVDKTYVYWAETISPFVVLQTCFNPRGLVDAWTSLTEGRMWRLATPGSSFGTIRVQYSTDGQPNASQLVFQAHESPISAIRFNNGGNLLATCGHNGTVVRLFSISQRNVFSTHEFRRGFHPVEIGFLQFSPDDTSLVTTSSSNTVHIFSLSKSKNGLPNKKPQRSSSTEGGSKSEPSGIHSLATNLKMLASKIAVGDLGSVTSEVKSQVHHVAAPWLAAQCSKGVVSVEQFYNRVQHASTASSLINGQHSAGPARSDFSCLLPAEHKLGDIRMRQSAEDNAAAASLDSSTTTVKGLGKKLALQLDRQSVCLKCPGPLPMYVSRNEPEAPCWAGQQLIVAGVNGALYKIDGSLDDTDTKAFFMKAFLPGKGASNEEDDGMHSEWELVNEWD